MARRVWLGNNVASTLTVGDKTVEIAADEKDRTVNLTEGQEAFLTRRGHRFAKPGSDEAEDPPLGGNNPGAGVPPIPASAGTSTEGTPAAETPRKPGK